MNPTIQNSNLALSLIEAGLTIAGVVAALTPLILWTAWSIPVFYTVLSVGGAAFLVFIGLAKLRGMILQDSESNTPGMREVWVDNLSQRRVDWEHKQKDDQEIRSRQRSIKGDVGREFSFMVRVSSSLFLGAILLFVAAWTFLDFSYG